MRLHTILLLCSLFLFASCSSKSKKTENKDDKNESVATELKEEALPVAKPYSQLKQECDSAKTAYTKAYNNARNNKVAQDSILLSAQNYLIDISDQFFRAWYNTPWDFNGHTDTPKKGKIACGYFVTTTLRDMGFKINRYKWAQKSAENLVKIACSDIKYFYKRPMSDIIKHIEENGEGLYIVGLDSHVGYIYYHKGKMQFVHSNYYLPEIGVMSENLIGRNPLNDSKNRVIGKLFDKQMMQRWLENYKYPNELQ